MAEAARNWWGLYRQRIEAAKAGRVCQHDADKGPQQAARPDHDGAGLYFKVCAVLSYLAIVAFAFAVHPLAGLLFLWLAFYIAPIAAVLLMAALPFVLLAVVGFGALVAYYWP